MIQNMTPLEKTSAGVGGGTAFFGSFAMNEIAIWVGIIATLLTFAASQFWQWRRDRREERKLDYELGLKEDRRGDALEVATERRK